MVSTFVEFSRLLSRYEAFFVDLWGVVHDGFSLLPRAKEALAELQARKKNVIFVSNTPRLIRDVVPHLERMGCPRSLYQDIVTSGEDLHQKLKNPQGEFYENLGPYLYHLGPAVKAGLMEDVAFSPVLDLEKASFILNTGPLTNDHTIKQYESLLNQGLELKLPMVCANPDLQVFLPRGEVVMCAGSLSAFYADRGGLVHYHGKPYPAIYEEALKRLQYFCPKIGRDSILAVGDSMASDVYGALDFGIDVAFIPHRQHAQDMGLAPGQTPTLEKLKGFLAPWPKQPHFIIPGLAV